MAVATVVSRGYLAAVDGVSGRVRATFDRSAYVTIDGGPSLVLHAAGGGHTPTSLCPASWPPAGWAVGAGDIVVGRAGHLKVGELVLDVRGARTWRPAPAANRAGAIEGLAPRATAGLAGTGAVHRLAPHAAATATLHRRALRAAGERTGELMPSLERALARRDGARVIGCVASLVGLGPGLTPSGDDALVGVLAVLHRLAPAGEGSLDLLHTAVLEHVHRTGDISAHYLRLAAAGHVGERLVALCDALASGARDEVDAATAAVVATGATSGADALLGVVSGLRLLASTCANDLVVAA